MRRRDFTPQCPGKLVDDFDGRASFVPEPLPPKLTLTATLIKAISDVSGSLGRLDGTAQTLPDPKVLIRTFVRREAQLSSYIENTYARYDEVADAERAGDDAPVSEPVRETRNAERTILAGVKAVITDGAHVNNALIRRLHAELLDRVRGHESRGQFRQKPVYIGREELGADHARFVPPPFHL